MSAIKSAADVKALLTNTLANNPTDGKWPAAINVAIVDAHEKLGQLAAMVVDLRGKLGQLVAMAQSAVAPANGSAGTLEVPQVAGAPQAAQPRYPVAPQGGPPPNSNAKYVNGQRIGADGNPMSPEEQALEEQMDAASAPA